MYILVLSSWIIKIKKYNKRGMSYRHASPLVMLYLLNLPFHDNFCVSWLLLILVPDKFAYSAFHCDSATGWVLDAMHVTFDIAIYCGVFENEVCVLAKSAVLEREAINIAKQLLASEVAANETYVLAVPCKILTVDFRIIDGHIL